MKQQEKNEILNYESQFKELKNLKEIVRKLPGMYIGATGNKGVLNMIREVFQNSFDEIMKTSFCDSIEVVINENDLIITISDNGKGIPFGILDKVFITQHMSTNYKKEPFMYSSGRHGIGAKVTNVLSEFFEVYSYILGECMYIRYEEGELVIPPTKIENNDKNRQGTSITFKPSKFMGNITLTANDIKALILNLFPLSKIGSKLRFKTIEAKSNNVICEDFINEYGILDHLIALTDNPLIAPIKIYDDNGTMKIDTIFTFDIRNNEPLYMSFANYTPVVGGTHIEAFFDAVCKFFKDYMNKIYLASNKKNKLTIINNDIKASLVSVITVCHLEPIFVGQSKDMLSNEDIIDYVKSITFKTLDEWAKLNSKDLQKLCKYIKEVAEIRVKSEEGKVKLTTKYESNAITGLPRKYVKPTGKEHLELIITEGDSALGPAKNNRCTKRQGLFPIRGKLPNAFGTKPANFLANEEVASIITIIGAGYGKNFDIDKCKFEKIIFMTDADNDGAHIKTLLLSFFLLYMPELIMDGRIYAATPPLYGLNVGTAKKKSYKYFRNRLDYIKFIQHNFAKQYDVSDLKNKKLSDNEMVGLLYRNILYSTELELVANNYALNPKLLELVLLYISTPIETLTKHIKDKFGKHMTVNNINNVITIQGLVENEVETLFLNDALINESKYILDLIHDTNGSIIYYNVNGVILSLYEIMKLFDNSAPKEITNYKGLGEMNGDQLAQSTLHPDMDRTLIQYTMHDAKTEIEAIRSIYNDKSKLAKSIEVNRMDILG